MVPWILEVDEDENQRPHVAETGICDVTAAVEREWQQVDADLLEVKEGERMKAAEGRRALEVLKERAVKEVERVAAPVDEQKGA